MDTKAFFKLSYGLYVVTTKNQSQESGCIINTMTQVTASPSQVSIALNKDNYTTELIKQSGLFNVGVLLESVPMEIISLFGFQSGRDVNKFNNLDYEEDCQGIKYLTKDIAASFSCKVTQIIDVGTHLMFIAEVVDTKVLSEAQVLTYSTYHDKKNGATPKNAPSYIEETTKSGYRCDVCGFIYDGEAIPADYICPVCKVDSSHFYKI